MPLRPTTVGAVAAMLLIAAAPARASFVRTHGPDPAPPAAPASAGFATVAAASDWCANTATASRQFDNGDYRYHAIYVHPADRPSRLTALGGELQAAAFGASALLEREYRRAIRFDVGTPCGREQLDISELQLPFTEAQLSALAAAGGAATFDAVAGALRTAGFGVADKDEAREQLASRTENYVVWLDGPSPPRSCGQGTALLDTTRSQTNVNNFGGKLALIFRQGREFCGADVVRHEIGHNLGALQPDAPHAPDGVHCDDAFEDTMCGLSSPRIAGGAFNGLYFDYGNDDYWDPPQGQPLGWWTLNLSRFLCPTPDCNRPAAPRILRHARARDRGWRAARNGRSHRPVRCRREARDCRAGRFGRA